MKKFLALAIVLVACITPMTAIHADSIDEHWTPSAYPQSSGWKSLYIQDGSTLNREPSALFASEMGVPGQTTSPNSFLCSSLESSNCIKYPYIQMQAFLQPCSGTITTNCIEGVYAVDESGKRIDAINPVTYPTASKTDFEGNDALNLPVGKNPAVWDIPGVVHGGGTTKYMVQVFVNGDIVKTAGTQITNQKFNINRLTAAITPVNQISGRFLQQVATDYDSSPEHTPRGVNHPSQDEWRQCAMVGDGNCQEKEPFPTGNRFGLKIRLQQPVTGWLHGRIYNPDVTITTAANGSQVIDVVASSVRVPVIGDWFKWEDLTKDIQDYILSGNVQGGQGQHTGKANATGNFQEMPPTSGDYAFKVLGLWIPQIKDKASANPGIWSFYNLQNQDMQNADACIRNSKELAGFVTTNATVYSAGPPTYSRENGSLDYKVMAPHFTAKGEVFKGTYDLRIRSDVARCIYGFSSAPIKASISIISADGTAQTATEVINERNGWLSLSANAFEYSSPTIKVKVTQEAPAPTPTPTVTETSKPVVAKTTITCVKGKTTKKVTAVKPTCPSGFKKR